ncbi:MAG: hypothetical protein KatS3mg095_0374 [Candidatus Parcubacteria bacterium]|nr:MAG: hypothetical protein KatS3mg095_0374 [Candidatus Parcubacteria bacterium]
MHIYQIKSKKKYSHILENVRMFFLSKKLIRLSGLFILFFILTFSFVFAHTEDAELNAEIQKGRELVEKFYSGEIKCQNLTDEDFHSIGEYVMEQMVGGSDHLTMNKMIEQMHGKEGEKLMHINMGKRFLGCETPTSPNYTRTKANNFFMMPMMGPMMVNWGQPGMGYWWWNFTNWRGWNILGPVFGILGTLWLLIILIFPILVLILLILGIIYLIKKLKTDIRKE